MAHSRTPFPALSSQRAATSPEGEPSGLIDIRTLGAVVATTDASRGPAARTVEARDELPSFGGLSLSLSPVAQPEPVRPITATHAAAPRSQAPLLALLGVLTAGVLGLAGYVVSLPAPQAAAPVVHVIQQRDVLADSSVKRAAEPEPAEVADAPEVVSPEPETAPTKERKATPRKPGKPGEPAKSEASATPSPAALAPKPAEKADYGVDCILGKAACGDKPAPKAEPERPAAPPASDLPEKLEQADISAGTAAARAAAASGCAKLAKGGEKVQVKLSIAGPTGSVIGASPLEDAGNPQLASCVAGELKQASFRKVRKEQTGTVVTVKF